MPRDEVDNLPPAPPVRPETPDQQRERRMSDLARTQYTQADLAEYLQDTLDPLSVEERQWMQAAVDNAGDTKSIAKQMGMRQHEVRAILARPRIRLALGRFLQNQASPESIVAALVDLAFGQDRVSEHYESGKKRKVDHKSRLDALLALAKMRGLFPESISSGTTLSEAQLNQHLKAQLARVKGLLPNSAPSPDVVEGEVVTRPAASGQDATPDEPLDPAGLPPNTLQDVD